LSPVGVSSRVKGWTTDRVHELFSQLELRYFYLLDWSVLVTDIREQYPLLPLEETKEIAHQLNIRHPANPRTKDPIVMTTDFVVTVGQSIGVTEQARTVKPKEKLSSVRVLEKLEIGSFSLSPVRHFQVIKCPAVLNIFWPSPKI